MDVASKDSTSECIIHLLLSEVAELILSLIPFRDDVGGGGCIVVLYVPTYGTGRSLVAPSLRGSFRCGAVPYGFSLVTPFGRGAAPPSAVAWTTIRHR